MLFWITCRLTASLAEHDPDIKAFVESSYLSKTVALKLFGNESIGGHLGWTFNASDLERPKIEVSIEHFLTTRGTTTYFMQLGALQHTSCSSTLCLPYFESNFLTTTCTISSWNICCHHIHHNAPC